MKIPTAGCHFFFETEVLNQRIVESLSPPLSPVIAFDYAWTYVKAYTLEAQYPRKEAPVPTADARLSKLASFELTPNSRWTPPKNRFARILLGIYMTTMLALLLAPSANADVIYTQNFNGAVVGTTGSTLGDGSFIVSNTGVATIYHETYPGAGDWKGLQLTKDLVENTQAAYYLPDLNAGQSINAFTASFDSMMYNAGGTIAADAWAFNFGNITNKSTAYIGAGNGMQSDGNATDVLTVSFTTYQTNQIQVWYNGSQIGGSYGTPAVFTDTFADKFRATTISWDEVNGLSLNYGGSQLISNLAISGFNPGTGYSFGFNAWTGAAAQGVYLDNISIATTAEPQAVPEPTTSVLIAGAAGLVGFGRSRTRRQKKSEGQ